MKTAVDVRRSRIGVVGAGSWGTALANLLALKGAPVDLWVFEADVKEQIRSDLENRVFLPGITLSKNLRPSNDLQEVVSHKDMLLVATPSHVTRQTLRRCAAAVDPATVVVSASKGIENQTRLTMLGVLREELKHIDQERLAVISGPSFAGEVARKIPTLVTAASSSSDTAAYVQHIFATPYFRVYRTDDTIGVELGGAVKNVIAIGAGIIDGLGLGMNTRAALITRGLSEIRRLGQKLGARPQTFAGLAGVGDLVLTCTGTLSRNHTVGKRIGEGDKLPRILDDMRMVAEGVKTALSVYDLSRDLNVEMPISHQVYRVLYEDLPPEQALYSLMTRDLKKEFGEYSGDF